MSTLPSHPFWEYSLRVLSESTVKAACLQLQDRFGLNVNLLLFCCWYANVGYGVFPKKMLAQIVTELSGWHQKLTVKLRHLRQHLESYAARSKLCPKLQMVYQDVLVHEIAAEQIEQLSIIHLTWGWKYKRRAAKQKTSDAIDNLHLYCELAKVALDKKGYDAAKVLLNHVFPQVTKENTHQLTLPL